MTRTAFVAILISGTLWAQSAKGPAGHWEGKIQTPDSDLNIEIDLAQDAASAWIGTISIPAQGTKGLGLLDVTVKEGAVSFGIKAPGDPRFQGTVAKDGGKISGDLVQNGVTMPFQLARTGEAKIEKPVRNPPLSKELEGTWEGALDAGGQKLRLRFVLSNQAGAGTGFIISLDQGNVEIPISKIAQTGSRVTVEVPTVGGGFTGELKGTQIDGEWSQNGGSAPLQLTKSSK